VIPVFDTEIVVEAYGGKDKWRELGCQVAAGAPALPDERNLLKTCVE